MDDDEEIKRLNKQIAEKKANIMKALAKSGLNQKKLVQNPAEQDQIPERRSAAKVAPSLEEKMRVLEEKTGAAINPHLKHSFEFTQIVNKSIESLQ